VRRGIVIGLVAGLLISAGGAMAAGRYIITSVNQIGPGVRVALKGNRGNQGPRGAIGQRGLRGITGPVGTPGLDGKFSAADVITVMGPVATMPPGQVGSSLVSCPSGTVLSGGWDGTQGAGPSIDASVAYNEPLFGSWSVIMSNNASIPTSFQTYAVCTTGAAPDASRHAEDRRNVRAIVQREVRAVEAQPTR
jgi:hypothetical protein